MADNFDPFLQAHVLAEGIFNIGGNISPVSIRDQMIRAQLIVERAYEAGYISASQPLMIVGAGAAGISAAMCAVAYGIPTTLVQKDFQRNFPQNGCLERWIDPCMYDWPYIHWVEGRYPAQGGKRAPLRWVAGIANRIVTEQWLPAVVAWEKESATKALLVTRKGKTVSDHGQFDPHTGQRLITLSDGEVRFASVVLCCCGPGKEQNALFDRHKQPIFASPGFWDHDYLTERGLHLLHPPRRPRVLICGGGDGALQDFIRVLTRQSNAAELLRGLTLTEKFIRNIHAAQAQATRSHLWAATPAHDHVVANRTESKFREAVEDLMREVPGIDDEISKMLVSVDDGRPIVELAHQCTHFGRCYAANRVLVMLLVRHLSVGNRNGGVMPRLTNRTVTFVEPAAKVAHSNCDPEHPEKCLSWPHRVRLKNFTCFSEGPELEPTIYDRVVLRFGPEPPGNPLGTPIKTSRGSSAQPRQVLPFFLLAGASTEEEPW